MKKLFPVCIAVIMASLIGYQTLAYLNVQTTATNVITTSSLDVDLVNMAVDENGNIGDLAEEITSVLPGDTYSQMPYVENTGDEDFYARVYLKSEIVGQDGEVLPNPLVFDIDETKWKKDADGWYRYVDIIKAGEQCPDPLFTTIHFPGSMDNSYVGSVTDVNLVAQAVQSDNNEHADVLDVLGWPEVGGAD